MSVREHSLELVDVELATEPLIAFFRIRVDVGHAPRTVMKRYADLQDFFDALQPHTRFVSLPRNVDEIALAEDPQYRRAIQAQLDALVLRLDIVRCELFSEFFQLSDEYQGRKALHMQSPATTNPLLAAHQPQDTSMPNTWPLDRQDNRNTSAQSPEASVSLLWELPPNPRRGIAGDGAQNAPPTRGPPPAAYPPTAGDAQLQWQAVGDAQLQWQVPSPKQDFLLGSRIGPLGNQSSNSAPATNTELTSPPLGEMVSPDRIRPARSENAAPHVRLQPQADLRAASPLPTPAVFHVPLQRSASPHRGTPQLQRSVSPLQRSAGVPTAVPTAIHNRREASPSTFVHGRREASPSTLVHGRREASPSTLHGRRTPSPVHRVDTAGMNRSGVPTVNCAEPLRGADNRNNVSIRSDMKASVATVGSCMTSGYKSGSSWGSGERHARPWCVICMAKPEEVAVDPCGHLSMCETCASMVQQCPVCRCQINKLLRVFVVR